MTWNWQNPDWPNFRWEPTELAQAEGKFLLGAGVTIGTARHLADDDRIRLAIELMSSAAVSTSAIEGELLNRASVQSSIQRQLGMGAADKRRIPPAEQGIAEVMVALYRSYAAPLTEDNLLNWHRLIAAGRTDLAEVGHYRTRSESMQIVSGPIGAQAVHFEAPPSEAVPFEMQRFVEWFNRTAPSGPEPLAAIARAGTAHLYFESIHPFEDGNGRVGRAVAEKALVQSFGQPALVSLPAAIHKHQKAYYRALERASRSNEIGGWLNWFAGIALEAQRNSMEWIEFLVAKTKIFDRLACQFNSRQEKALLRMFREGPEGFEGGLSAGNYSTITGAPPATTTRDLRDLVEKKALLRTGERRHARYTLNLHLD